MGVRWHSAVASPRRWTCTSRDGATSSPHRVVRTGSFCTSIAWPQPSLLAAASSRIPTSRPHGSSPTAPATASASPPGPTAPPSEARVLAGCHGGFAMIEQYVLGLQEVGQMQVAVVGGKGAHLGELSRIDGI